MLINANNYVTSQSSGQKQANWKVLTSEVLERIGVQMSPSEVK